MPRDARNKGFPLWQRCFQKSELLPIIPPGAPIADGSKVSPENAGKVPGQKRNGVWWGFGGSWPQEQQTTLDEIKQWHKDGASVGLQTRIFVAIDIDVENAQRAAEFEEAALRILGPAPVRYRENSNRRLLLYRIKDGEPPLRKVSVKYMDGEAKELVEQLGHGQQCVVEGPHTSGGEYLWRGWHPCDKGPSALTEITHEKSDAFFAEVQATLDLYGYEIAAHHGSKDSTTPRKGLDDARLHAPSPEHVLDALKQWRPEEMGHDEYVQALAAIKMSLGERRDEFMGDVLAWSPGARSTEDEAFTKRWHSIKDSRLGWSWLSDKAGVVDYDDVPSINTSNGRQKNPVERMLDRFIWCNGLEAYMDLEVNEPQGPDQFASKNTQVAEYGTSGTKSARAQFHNNPAARKVEIMTYRPGKPHIVKELNAGGVMVDAYNRWRPSQTVPVRGLTDDDVRPYLDHVEHLFGPLDGPDTKHFLDFCAFVLQRPGEKINHAVVLLGERQGTGKDTVLRPVFEAVGDKNWSLCNPEAFSGQFNSYLLAQVVYVPEIMNFHRKEIGNKLKDLMTVPQYAVTINEKHTKPYIIPKIQNWFMSTNYEDALSLEDSDRRFWVFKILLENPLPESYYKALHNWLDAGGVEKAAGWLMDRDISAFNPMAAAPMTDAKKAMIELSQPKGTRWIAEQLTEEGGEFHGRELVTAAELVGACRDNFNGTHDVRESHAIAALRRAGYRKLPHGRVRAGRGFVRLWAGPQAPLELLSQLAGAQLLERYENGKRVQLGGDRGTAAAN
jgi:hypothetical protein